jgi:hypothetical protein
MMGGHARGRRPSQVTEQGEQGERFNASLFTP